MRYYVKNSRGEELVCPSLADLHALYRQGFFDDEDWVKPEGSERWVRADQLPALRGLGELRRDRRRIPLLIVGAIALVGLLALLLRKRP
jgi:hypothetical protein